jgi:hypothetical protein
MYWLAILYLCPRGNTIGKEITYRREVHLNIYPASEKTIWEVERGRSDSAILPMPAGRSLAAGDSLVFALAISHAGEELCYVRGGDSVRVLLTGVTNLGTTDPITGRALFRLSWEPLGQERPPPAAARGAQALKRLSR